MERHFNALRIRKINVWPTIVVRVDVPICPFAAALKHRIDSTKHNLKSRSRRYPFPGDDVRPMLFLILTVVACMLAREHPHVMKYRFEFIPHPLVFEILCNLLFCVVGSPSLSVERTQAIMCEIV